ncbi:hypothetical protein AaE_016237 [Aphanomyces astaci]|uniref:Core-binding (CB) domain-containing protein n=1 Tax=Aphanomyces astaci TaxID=112090 RepID=A0A6A4YZA3_APHAT|nr:hypothetical protein AaE_016237 [Aphanomyces astaci]
MLTPIGSIDFTVFTYDHFLLFIQWAFQNTSNKPGTLASYRSAIKDYYKQQGVAVPREYDEDMKDLFQGMNGHWDIPCTKLSVLSLFSSSMVDLHIFFVTVVESDVSLKVDANYFV